MENHCCYLIIISAWSVEFTGINYQIIIKLVVQCADVFNLLRKEQDSHRLAVAKLLDCLIANNIIVLNDLREGDGINCTHS